VRVSFLALAFDFPRRLFGDGKSFHADHRAVGVLRFRVSESQVGGAQDIAFQNQAGVVIQRRVILFAIRMRWEPSGESTQIWLSKISCHPDRGAFCRRGTCCFFCLSYRRLVLSEVEGHLAGSLMALRPCLTVSSRARRFSPTRDLLSSCGLQTPRTLQTPKGAVVDLALFECPREPARRRRVSWPSPGAAERVSN